jgi:hypothetical protein
LCFNYGAVSYWKAQEGHRKKKEEEDHQADLMFEQQNEMLQKMEEEEKEEEEEQQQQQPSLQQQQQPNLQQQKSEFKALVAVCAPKRAIPSHRNATGFWGVKILRGKYFAQFKHSTLGQVCFFPLVGTAKEAAIIAATAQHLNQQTAAAAAAAAPQQQQQVSFACDRCVAAACVVYPLCLLWQVWPELPEQVQLDEASEAQWAVRQEQILEEISP